jgi:hypothetical protein
MPEYVFTDDTIPVKISNGGYATPPTEEPVTQHIPGSDTVGMVISGVPDQIQRAKVLEFLTSIGVKYEDLIGFSLYHHAFVIEMFALDTEGKRYVIQDPKDGDHMAVHKISVPIRP